MEFIVAGLVIILAGIATAFVMIKKPKKEIEDNVLTPWLDSAIVQPTPKKRPVKRKRKVSNESIKKRSGRGSGKRKRSRSGGVQKPHRVDKG